MGKVNGTSTHVEEMYAFLAVDEEDQTEGICSMYMGPQQGHMPLIGADLARVESLREMAEFIGKEAGLEIRLVRYSTRTDVQTLRDGIWES